MSTKKKGERLGEFHASLVADPYQPSSASDAVAFLKRHLDAVELAALPPQSHQDISVRMILPSLSLGAGAGWSQSGVWHIWKGNNHVVEVSGSGDIKIKELNGALWFTRS